MKRKGSLIIQCVVVGISLYCFFEPTILTFGGYSLAIDGIVVARTICLLFSLANIIDIIKKLEK